MPLGSEYVSSHPPALRRSGRARTTRYRDDFIDTTLLQYVAPPDEPHAFAEEDEPTQSKKSPAPKALSPKPSPSISYQYPDDRPVGPDHQAGIPTLRARPAQPTRTESKFLRVQPLYASEQLGAAGSADRAANAAAFKAQYQAAQDAAAKRALLDAAVQYLDAQMGPEMVQVLHLGQLGSKLRPTWQTHEELLFCLGMCDKYRFFKYIRQCYLWQRSAHELNGYYHNVWKTRSTPEAEEFLTLREQGASKEVMWQFVDKIRSRLTSMWDRKKMGDMPKLLKDAAAAAAADAELQAAAAMEAAYSEGRPASPSASLDTVSDDSVGAAAVVVLSKPRQRKRPAAAAAVSSKQNVQPQPQALAVKQEQEHEAAAPGQQQQQQQEQSAPAAQQVAAMAAEHGVQQQQPKRQRRQQQQQQQQQQQRGSPASATAVQAVAVVTAPVVDGQAVMQYPEMPTYPEPDITNAAALEEWMKHIPAYRALMTEYMKTVNCMTDAAVEGYQKRIHEAQQHRERLQAQADAYIRSLVAQGQQVLRQVEVRAASHHHQQQQQQLQAAPVTPAQPLPVPVEQVVLQQQQPAQQQQQQQQPQQAVPAQRESTGDLQSAVQQLLVTHTKHTKQQLQAKLTGAPAAAQPGVQPAQQQVQAQAQQAQAQRQASTEPLPFPMGPASKWLSQGSAGGAAVGAPVEVRCGRSSSEDCEVFLACNEGTLC